MKKYVLVGTGWRGTFSYIEPLVREYGDCARLCAVCDINGKRARFPGEYLHVDLPATRILIRCSGIISLTW